LVEYAATEDEEEVEMWEEASDKELKVVGMEK